MLTGLTTGYVVTGTKKNMDMLSKDNEQVYRKSSSLSKMVIDSLLRGRVHYCVSRSTVWLIIHNRQR